MGKGPGRWAPAEATRHINECAVSPALTLSWTAHALERLAERELLTGDVIYLLQKGFVYEEPKEASRDGLFKYRVEGTTPNSEGRTVRVVVIPSGGCAIKVVTVMWRDEK